MKRLIVAVAIAMAAVLVSAVAAGPVGAQTAALGTGKVSMQDFHF
ncbi:hypothetical protein [Dactylosporangium sp. NPDC051541]